MGILNHALGLFWPWSCVTPCPRANATGLQARSHLDCIPISSIRRAGGERRGGAVDRMESQPAGGGGGGDPLEGAGELGSGRGAYLPLGAGRQVVFGPPTLLRCRLVSQDAADAIA